MRYMTQRQINRERIERELQTLTQNVVRSIETNHLMQAGHVAGVSGFEVQIGRGGGVVGMTLTPYGRDVIRRWLRVANRRGYERGRKAARRG